MSKIMNEQKWKREDGLLCLRTLGSPLVACMFSDGSWVIDNITTRRRVAEGEGDTADAEHALAALGEQAMTGNAPPT